MLVVFVLHDCNLRKNLQPAMLVVFVLYDCMIINYFVCVFGGGQGVSKSVS